MAEELCYLNDWLANDNFCVKGDTKKKLSQGIQLLTDKDRYNLVNNCIGKLTSDGALNFLEIFDQKMKTVTMDAVILVKNQDKYISKTVNEALAVSDGVVVLDTGSNDGTINIVKSIAEKNTRVKLYEEKWVEDYGHMRNIAKGFAKSEWIYMWDSDEELDKKYGDDIKYMLSFLSTVPGHHNYSINLKVHGESARTFVTPTRILKNSADNFFYGRVHEEVRSRKEIIMLDSNVLVTNHGEKESERKKFDKKERYKTLIFEMLKEEPNESRWVSFIPVSDFKEFMPDEEVRNLLRKNIFKDSNKKDTLGNVKKSPYLMVLISKYITFLSSKLEIDNALKIIKIAQKLYPHNTNFLFFKYSLLIVREEKNVSKIIDNLLFDSTMVEDNSSFEVSQGPDDNVKALIVQLLISNHSYELASNVINQVKEPYVMDMLSEEKTLLDNIK